MTTDWMSRSLCNMGNRHLFYSEDPREIREAKAICADCTTRVECLDYALETKEEFGIWAGYDVSALNQIAKHRVNHRKEYDLD